ncbi:hypothetical protein GA0061098_104912 [Bradyrhizobium shewense]|uniref:Uncharacterized protein n=1 Tax=Bradyrhizobium shewense TaxID=1761772 RepID=A0A1C3XTU1_9BRAD|nr:hypothetical protein GA0061098_104912 [Bradyrhizobium shewense]
MQACPARRSRVVRASPRRHEELLIRHRGNADVVRQDLLAKKGATGLSRSQPSRPSRRFGRSGDLNGFSPPAAT